MRNKRARAVPERTLPRQQSSTDVSKNCGCAFLDAFRIISSREPDAKAGAITRRGSAAIQGDAVERTIRECAQKIIMALERLGEANLLRLSEHVAERSVITYQALGWLAHEGQVRYEQRGSQTYVALPRTENI